jgi:hypothetical protein
MATVKIEINTETGSREGAIKSSLSTERVLSKPIMLVSTIRLSQELRGAFEAGAGQRANYYDDTDYDDLRDKISRVDGPNRLIVTAGGLIAFQAAKDVARISNFVSLVGVEPTGDIGNCYGGVTLKSFNANSDRVDYLEGQGRMRANIGLFCNPKSAMNGPEERDWGKIPGVNASIVHGGNTHGRNDSSHYLEDFNGAGAHGITTLVISADPFFFHTREKLIKAANQWLASDGRRHICYPLKNYSNTDGNSHPARNVSSWYGPDLLKGYETLGSCAAHALTATSPMPFSSVADTWGIF